MVECKHCGRKYDDLTQAELSRMTHAGPCPSDDCPGYDFDTRDIDREEMLEMDDDYYDSLRG